MIVRTATADDREWLRSAYDADWGGPVMVADGVARSLLELPTLVAEEWTELLGYAVYEPAGDGAEIVALEAHPRGQGVARALVERLMETVDGVLTAVTTNDNLDAIGFYQRLGFRIADVRLGAVDRSRRVKPSIPEVGERGIPLHDELVLQWRRMES